MNRIATLAAVMLSVTVPTRAIPPPPRPELSPETQAAAAALASRLPFEEALAQSNYLRSDGIIAHRVTDRLMSTVDRRRRLRCKRDYVRIYLVDRVAQRLPDMLPEAARRLRRNFAAEIGYRMNLEELIAGRAILETASGRSLILNSWGFELAMNDMTASAFTGAIYGEFEILLRDAVSDCRRLGRPVPPPM